MVFCIPIGALRRSPIVGSLSLRRREIPFFRVFVRIGGSRRGNRADHCGVRLFQRVRRNVPGGLGTTCGSNVGRCGSYAQLSPLIPRFPRCRHTYAKTMMLRALKGVAMVPAVRLGPPERKTELRFVDPEGGRAGISRSPASRRRAQARGTFSDARRLQAQCPLVPGFDLCPGCGRGRKGFHRRIGVFHKRGAWPAPREVSGVPLVGTRCRCPRTCIPDASSYEGGGIVRRVSCGPCLFCLSLQSGLNKYAGCPPTFPP